MSGVLCLKWNNHSPTFLKTLDNFRTKELYCDATIVCQGKYYPVHKFTLTTCSTYFEEIFERAECKHPFIVLKDMDCAELEALLNYMYKGEVNVLQEMLPGLIRAAESLKVKGLAVSDDEPPKDEPTTKHKKRNNSNDSPNPAPKKSRRLEDKKTYGSSHQKKHNGNSGSSDEQIDKPDLNSGYSSANSINFLNNVLEEVMANNSHQSSTKSTEPKSVNSSSSKVKESQQDEVLEVEEIDVKSEPFEIQEHAVGYVSNASNAGRPQSLEDKEESLFGTLLSPQMSRSGSEEHLNDVLTSDHHLPLPQCSSWSDPNIKQGDDDEEDMQQEILGIGHASESAISGLDSFVTPFLDTLGNVEGDMPSTSKHSFSISNSSAYLHQCMHCSYQSKAKHSMRLHVMRRHTGERPFACSLCSYKCVLNEHLQRHMRKHTGERPFSCPFCPYKASQKHCLVRHIKKIHMKEANLSCSFCSYKTSRKSLLHAHMKKHL